MLWAAVGRARNKADTWLCATVSETGTSVAAAVELTSALTDELAAAWAGRTDGSPVAAAPVLAVAELEAEGTDAAVEEVAVTAWCKDMDTSFVTDTTGRVGSKVCHRASGTPKLRPTLRTAEYTERAACDLAADSLALAICSGVGAEDIRRG
jgi:hypothetical protein